MGISTTIRTSNHFFASTVTAGLLTLAGSGTGCGGSLPAGPSPATVSASPSVTAVSPITGSTGGYTTVRIAGTGFESGATVTIGGITVNARFDRRDRDGTTMYFEAPAHEAGLVDVVVTNPQGRTAALTGAYVYASPRIFDFNGDWSGFGTNGQDIPILFTIRNNALVSVKCDTFVTLAFSPPLSVTNSQFSFSRDDGVAVSGAIVAVSEAHGTIDMAPCSATTWVATRQ